jgi:hypothetical protein
VRRSLTLSAVAMTFAAKRQRKLERYSSGDHRSRYQAKKLLIIKNHRRVNARQAIREIRVDGEGEAASVQFTNGDQPGVRLSRAAAQHAAETAAASKPSNATNCPVPQEKP